MALAASLVNERKRVKVYELRGNDWFDRGTGYCAVQTINNDGRILVESEDEPDRTLLEVKVKKEDNYQKQQDTLIVWTDPEGTDMALSFQEAEGCGIVWSTISDVQQRISDGIELGQPTQLMLPPAELKYVPDIEALVRGAGSSQQGRETLTKMIISENYLAQLAPLVEMAEDLEDLQGLHRLCNIVKALILYNDPAIVEQAVRDDVVYGVVGALEYDPDFPRHKANHRQYLAAESKFKEVVHLENEEIRRKIHITYRLQYLKDVVLARILDDPTFSVLNSLIYFHQIDIVQHITGNAALNVELFSVITDPSQPPQKKREAILFIQQCCTVAKPFSGPIRSQLYQNFVSYGLFLAIAFALQHHDAAVRAAGTEILVAVIDHDVTMIRTYIYKAVNEGVKPLTDTLIELLLVEMDLGVKAQVADAIKVLLEPISPGGDRVPPGETALLQKVRNSAAVNQQNDNFLQTFFDQSAKKLFQPLKDLQWRKSMSNLTVHEVSLFSHLLDILCFFIRQHSYRSKIFILSEGISSRAAQLLACPEKHVKLTAVKYFRAVLNLNDEHHNRQLIQHCLFEPILNILITTLPRDNLLNSACLDLFDYIRKETVRAVIYHLVESYRDRLESISYIESLDAIIRRYDQFTHPETITHSSTTGPDLDSSMITSDADTPNTRHVTINGAATRWQGLKDPDAEEDAYFNASDNEDDDEDELSRGPSQAHMNGASPITRPLVDYADDDEEDWADVHSKSHNSVLDDLTLSSSPSPAVLLSPTPVPTPPPTLAEKRRRQEDEDEDELGKLSRSSAKRRNSSASVCSSNSDSSWAFVQAATPLTADALSHVPDEMYNALKKDRKATSPRHSEDAEKDDENGEQIVGRNGSGLDDEKPADAAWAAATTPTRGPALRRKRAFSNGVGKDADVPAMSGEGERVVKVVGGRKIAFNLGKKASGEAGK